MRIFLLAALVVVGAGLLGREVLAVGAARRAGEPMVPHYRRLRRRVLGIALLIVLYVIVGWYDVLADWGTFTVRDHLLYVGGVFILLIWTLITASRDLKETAHEALAERRRLAADSFQHIQDEIERKKEENKGKAPAGKKKRRR